MKHALRSFVLTLLAAVAVPAPLCAQNAEPDRDRITREEITASLARDLYELVQSRRAHWLRTRRIAWLEPLQVVGPGTLEPVDGGATRQIVVYVNGVEAGGLDALRQIPTRWIASLEYLDGAMATQRFGSGHPYGAIVVSWRE